MSEKTFAPTSFEVLFYRRVFYTAVFDVISLERLICNHK